jgi:acyl carrier protein
LRQLYDPDSNMTTEERIRQFIVRELLWEGAPEDLGDDTSLIDSGVIDSLGIVKMVLFLDSEFGIKIPDEEILPTNFDTIRALSSFVEVKGAR